MEKFDVVDSNRKHLNYTKNRGEELEANEYGEGIQVWIINDGKVLMTRRSAKKSHPGSWEIPGGCAQAGEKIIDVVLREMREELGIMLKESDVEFVCTQLYKKMFVDIYTTKIYVELDKIKLQIEEVSQAKFVNREELEKMIEENEVVPVDVKGYELVKDKIEWK